jgi:hypothetical protein
MPCDAKLSAALFIVTDAMPQYGQVKLPNSTIKYLYSDHKALRLVSLSSNAHKGKSGAWLPTAGTFVPVHPLFKIGTFESIVVVSFDEVLVAHENPLPNLFYVLPMIIALEPEHHEIKPLMSI